MTFSSRAFEEHISKKKLLPLLCRIRLQQTYQSCPQQILKDEDNYFISTTRQTVSPTKWRGRRCHDERRHLSIILPQLVLFYRIWNFAFSCCYSAQNIHILGQIHATQCRFHIMLTPFPCLFAGRSTLCLSRDTEGFCLQSRPPSIQFKPQSQTGNHLLQFLVYFLAMKISRDSWFPSLCFFFFNTKITYSTQFFTLFFPLAIYL